jgi:hypothetical protein
MVSQQMRGIISYNNPHHANLTYEEFHALFYQSPNLLQHFHTSCKFQNTLIILTYF